MCSDLSDPINDCKVANGVHYCFCSGSDLCNGNMSQFLTRPPNEDDEDGPPVRSGDYDLLHTTADDSPTTAHPPHGTTTTNVSPAPGSATISRSLGLLPVMAALVTATAQ